MSLYELTFIVRPDVPTTQVETVLGRVQDFVKKAKGKVNKTEQWGLRTLAYPIKKHTRGYYTYVGLNMDGDAIRDLERQLELSDDVIRYLTVAIDELSKEPTQMMKAKNRAAVEEDFSL